MDLEKIIKSVVGFLLSFALLSIGGLVIQEVLISIPQEVGPFLGGAKGLIHLFVDILLPGPSEIYGFIITTLESILIAYWKFWKV